MIITCAISAKNSEFKYGVTYFYLCAIYKNEFII